MAWKYNPFTKKLDYYESLSGSLALDDLTDVDTSAESANDVLMFNGSEWVAVPEGTTFTFSLASFADNQTNTQLIGSGQWLDIGDISFTASYNNGPPTVATVTCTSWSATLDWVTPFTSASSTETTAYPANKDSTITFNFSATKAPTTVTSSSSVTFRNNIKYGISTDASGWDSTAINALTGTSLSSTYTGSYAINAGASDYILFAHPSSYTSLNDNGFIFNSVTCPFETPATVSVTNSAGFTENYKVYRSTDVNMGNSTLVTSTSSTLIDPIYWGQSTKTSGYDETDVEGLGTNVVSNTKGRTFTENVADNYYIIYALPTRLGTVVFWSGGFEGGFQAPETVSVTNVNGYAEDYYVYRSTNEGLGSTTITVV